MKTVEEMLVVVGKSKSYNVLKDDFKYYLQLSDNTEIAVSKEEFYLNSEGMKLRLESAVDYKWIA